ncbi:MAG: hypothetical protein LBE59_00640 [Nevskiaceae bacterium]|nr:hypothetical protein [Nevskiaceae bacterium]
MNAGAERLTLAMRLFTPRRAQLDEGARLVFVCTGNICRSPYAEFIARNHGLNAISAGVNTHNGLPANDAAIAEASRRGVDMRSHRTTRWQDVPLHSGDLILALELRHALATRERAAQHQCRVVLMSYFLQPRFAFISDPYGKTQREFAVAFDLIETAVGNLAARLRQRAV